jgi:branched-chain amino acid transport system substrate-binding protein
MPGIYSHNNNVRGGNTMRKAMLLILILSVLVISACAVQQPVVDDAGDEVKLEGTYKVGVLYPLTGDGAVYGLPLQKTTKIAIDEINKKGGVNGKKLEAIYEDGKCNPKDGNLAAQKLVNVDKVQVIIGGACSGETLGAAPIAEENQVILISPTATSPDITSAGDFIFRLAPSDAFAGIVASGHSFENLGAKKAAVISENTDYAQGLGNVFKQNFESLGGKIVADETFNPEDTDFRSQVTKVKAAKPDVIYLVPQTTPKGVLLLKQIKEAGVSQQLVVNEVLLGRNVIDENPELTEGMIGVEQKFDETNLKAAPLLAEYTRQANEEPPFPAFMSASYDIVYIIADAIIEVGYDGSAIKDYLYGLDDYEGAVGLVTLDENGDVVLEFSVKQVRDGVLVSIG